MFPKLWVEKKGHGGPGCDKDNHQGKGDKEVYGGDNNKRRSHPNGRATKSQLEYAHKGGKGVGAASGLRFVTLRKQPETRGRGQHTNTVIKSTSRGPQTNKCDEKKQWARGVIAKRGRIGKSRKVEAGEAPGEGIRKGWPRGQGRASGRSQLLKASLT